MKGRLVKVGTSHAGVPLKLFVVTHRWRYRYPVYKCGDLLWTKDWS
jgi:hypothetical protein